MMSFIKWLEKVRHIDIRQYAILGSSDQDELYYEYQDYLDNK